MVAYAILPFSFSRDGPLGSHGRGNFSPSSQSFGACPPRFAVGRKAGQTPCVSAYFLARRPSGSHGRNATVFELTELRRWHIFLEGRLFAVAPLSSIAPLAESIALDVSCHRRRRQRAISVAATGNLFSLFLPARNNKGRSREISQSEMMSR